MQVLWTDAERESVKSLNEMTAREIARALNLKYHGGTAVRSPRAIRLMRHRHSLAGAVPRWDIEKEVELRGLIGHEDKLTASQIGWRLGVSRMAVIGKCKRMGFKLPNGKSVIGGKNYKPDKKKEPQVFDGISGTPEPLALDVPQRAPKCKFRGEFMGRDIGLCDKEIVAGSYCADHYILSRGDKDAARATIERLAGR